MATESEVRQRDPNEKRYSPAQLARDVKNEELIDHFLRPEIPDLRQILESLGVKDVGLQGLNSSMLWLARGLYAGDNATARAGGYLFGPYLTQRIEKIAQQNVQFDDQNEVASIDWPKAIRALDEVQAPHLMKGFEIAKRHALNYLIGAVVTSKTQPGKPSPNQREAAAWANEVILDHGVALPAGKGQGGSRPCIVDPDRDLSDYYQKLNERIPRELPTRIRH